MSRRADEFRQQADSYRMTALGLTMPNVRDQYLGWAQDLERRAGIEELKDRTSQ